MTHWSRIKDSVRTAGGAWPPPGCKEVEQAVSVKPPRDHEHVVAMLLKQRKLLTAIHDGRTRCRAEVREQLNELNERIRAYCAETSDT